MTGFPVGLAMHMAKIIECASLCCLPGGRDAILATLDHEGFELDSMAPQRRATPVSVAAHSLYEQSDPFTVHEPEGRLDLARATYRAIDDRRTAFLLADVSGKGLGAALLTTMLQGALSGMMLGTDPARVFNHVNRFLCDHAEVGRYATMFFGILDIDGHLEFINAGHPSPILVRKDVAEEAFTEGSFPVGLVPEAEFTTASLQLQPEDTLVLFSDGVTEAMDPEEELYGVARLRGVLLGKADLPLEEIQKIVLESVENFARGERQADDLTLLVVRFRAVGADVSATDVSAASNAANPAS